MHVDIVGQQSLLFTHIISRLRSDWEVVAIGENIDAHVFITTMLEQIQGDALIIADHWPLVCSLSQIQRVSIPVFACISTYTPTAAAYLRSKGIYSVALPTHLQELTVTIEEQIPQLLREINS